MAINGIGPTTPNFQQVDNAAAERRLAEQRQLQQEEQRIREQQDFLTRQQLLAQNAQTSRTVPGTPAPGSIISVTA
jgi:hypothetical protein